MRAKPGSFARFLCAEAGTRAAAPFPAPLSPLSASSLRSAPDRFLLTKANTCCKIELPASLRSDGVRDHPGMPFGFPPEQAFSFTGIPTIGPIVRMRCPFLFHSLHISMIPGRSPNLKS